MPSEHIPSVLEQFEVAVEEHGQEIDLNVWDTSGSDSYGKIRPLTYDDVDVFIVCYAINSPISLENVRKKWIPEIRSHSRRTPFVLVGTKSDLRPHESKRKQRSRVRESLSLVDPVKANDAALTLGASASLECSSLKQTGIETVFSNAMQAALEISVAVRERKRKGKKKRRWCTLL